MDGWLFGTLFIKCQHPVKKNTSGQHARMENDIEKGDVDIFRDTPVRYLGIYLYYMFILLPVDAACMLLLSELFYVQDSILDKVWRGGGG